MPGDTLLQDLQGIGRKLRTMEMLHGLGLVMLWMTGLLALAIGMDYLLHLPAIPRLMVLMGLVGALGYFLYQQVVKPVARPMSLGEVASRLERAFPQFEDRLRSAVDFSDDTFEGSASMRQMVFQQATAMAQQVNLDSALVRGPVYRSLGRGAGALVLAMGLLLLLGHSISGIALSRLLNPFSDAAWPRRVQITLEGATPPRVPVGQRVPVSMRLTRGDKPGIRPVIYYQYGNGPVQKELMNRNADGTFIAALDARMDSAGATGQMRIWMEAGDDQARLPMIQVVPRLAVQRVTMQVTPPAYANLPPVTLDLSSGPAVVTTGSEAMLIIDFNKPLDSAHPIALEPVEQSTLPAMKWSGTTPDRMTAAFRVDRSFRFHVRGTDRDGFQNPALEQYELLMRPDQVPMVQIENPRRNEDRTAEAVIPMQGIAEDDFGISNVQLLVRKIGSDKSWTLDLVTNGKPAKGVTFASGESTADRKRYRLNWDWSLAESLKDAKLTGGDVLEYQLQVQDNYVLDGIHHSPVASGKLRISIVTQEQFTQRLIEQLRTVAQQVHDTRTIQQRTQGETRGLKQDTQQKPQFDQADLTATDRIGAQQSTAASQARSISTKLGEIQKSIEENHSKAEDLKKTVEDVKTLLEHTAENPMKDAATKIADVRTQGAEQPSQSPDPAKEDAARKDRNAALDAAIANQDQSIAKLDESLEKLGNVGTLSQSIQRINDLLNKQKDLSAQTDKTTRETVGRTPDKLTPEQRKELDRLATEQKKLADATDAAMNDLKKAADAMQQSDSATADSLRKAAQTGDQQQVSANQNQAARATSDNQQAQARSAQDSAELGLQMMLSDLREAEKRRMEQLSRKLEKLQGLIQDLVRRQAGHNLDNLSIQGDKAKTAIDAKKIEAWIALAGRDKNHLPPPPQVQQLSAGQEQTERNTRDIAKTAADQDQGQPVSDLLTRAAGKMERAAVELRENKLDVALVPSQDQAMDLLIEALDKVVQMQKQINDKRDQQKKDAIRDRYVKLREQQAAINSETTRLQVARNPETGALARKEAIRLGQLPGEQGKLSDSISELDNDLRALNSVVYVWANQDIKTSMDFIKDRLGQKETTAGVQSEQKRVLDLLDLMIRNLAATPPDQSKFANRPAGGGGGQAGSPKAQLPTEAELKLLRDLQESVNLQTKRLNDDPKRDPADLEILANRQAELRRILDKLLQQASRGQVKLGPEPDNRDQLPEEASDEDIEDRALIDELLTGAPADEKLDKDVHLIGDRMGRSRQRLGLSHDPGKVTQRIQERILLDFDKLQEMARQQQQQSSSQQQQQQQQEQANRPKEGDQTQPNSGDPQADPNNPQSNPANASVAPQGGGALPDVPPGEITEKMAEWGGLSARDRQAVIDAKSETVIEKYRRLTDDYYRSLATKATERK